MTPNFDLPFRERIKTPIYWWHRFIELVLSVSVVFVITTYLDDQEATRRMEVQATEWFEVDEIWIPDHVEGSNPGMIYERVIKRPFRGFWIAEAQLRQVPTTQAREFSNECTGSGVNNYEPDEVIPENTVSWQWFFGRECSVPPGAYRVVATWDLHIEGYPVKRLRQVSNVFRVFPKGYEPSLAPPFRSGPLQGR